MARVQQQWLARSPALQADSSPGEPQGKPLVPQLHPTLCDPVDGRLPGSSVRGILQTRIPEWVASPFSRRAPQPRD